MNKSKMLKILVFILLIAFILQAGFMAYSMIYNQSSDNQQGTSTQAVSVTTTSSVVISEEIQNLIKQSDTANFDKNINNYKAMLVKLDVHEKFKNEIERLIKAEYKLPDLLIAYEFLYENYEKIDQLEVLAGEKKSGKGWAQIFKDYYASNTDFKPGSFDPDYLDRLMSTSSITTDDIMMADRVAQKASVPVKEVINKKLEGMTWRELNAGLDIVNSQSKMPHIPVTQEQIKKYTQSGGLTEQQVVEALVIAGKLGITGDEVINKVKAGYIKGDIYAWCYEQKYY